MNRSSNAARYGALAERAARERYGLDADHTEWNDARTDNGRPVEVKSAMLNRASGHAGRFRIFERVHRRLASEDGVYVFVAYRASGRGISVEKMRSVDADAVRLEFYGAGGHRDTKQAKVPVSEVFGRA